MTYLLQSGQLPVRDRKSLTCFLNVTLLPLLLPTCSVFAPVLLHVMPSFQSSLSIKFSIESAGSPWFLMFSLFLLPAVFQPCRFPLVLIFLSLVFISLCLPVGLFSSVLSIHATFPTGREIDAPIHPSLWLDPEPSSQTAAHPPTDGAELCRLSFRSRMKPFTCS